MIALTDGLRSATLQFGLEMGHTVRWGGFLEAGALWPRGSPDAFASGGPLLGLGGSLAWQFADPAALLVTSGLAVGYLGCRAVPASCAVAGGSDELVFWQSLTRVGLRLTLFPDQLGTGLDLCLGPHWRQGLGT